MLRCRAVGARKNKRQARAGHGNLHELYDVMFALVFPLQCWGGCLDGLPFLFHFFLGLVRPAGSALEGPKQVTSHLAFCEDFRDRQCLVLEHSTLHLSLHSLPSMLHLHAIFCTPHCTCARSPKSFLPSFWPKMAASKLTDFEVGQIPERARAVQDNDGHRTDW